MRVARVPAATGSSRHVGHLHLLCALDSGAGANGRRGARARWAIASGATTSCPPIAAYAEVIEERLRAAKAVVVIWSAEAAKSQWVQSEADRAREASKLVQLSIDGATLPMPFDRIQCADMTGWTGDLEAPGWRKVVASVAELIGDAEPQAAVRLPGAAAASIETVDRRAAVRQSLWRSRAGLFRRRHGRGDRRRPVAHHVDLRHRQRLRPCHSRARGSAPRRRRASSACAMCWRAASARRAAACASPSS